MQRTLSLAVLLALGPVAGGEPVALQLHKFPRIIVGREKIHTVQIAVPDRHQVRGLKEIQFQFRPRRTGKVSIPETRFEVAGKTYLLPETQCLVFDRRPSEQTTLVSHWDHPSKPLRVVQLDFSGGKAATQPTLDTIEEDLIGVPEGFRVSAAASVVREDVLTHILHFENATGGAVTLTRDNFRDCNLPPDFPEIVIPPTSRKK